ncbi:PFU-domain-containing protein [Auricularia subglabra TFB-10046 SS5]|nr:PFU-domain-containing protein [Auricularia subglabra TFB-10046 SS5]
MWPPLLVQLVSKFAMPVQRLHSTQFPSQLRAALQGSARVAEYLSPLLIVVASAFLALCIVSGLSTRPPASLSRVQLQQCLLQFIVPVGSIWPVHYAEIASKGGFGTLGIGMLVSDLIKAVVELRSSHLARDIVLGSAVDLNGLILGFYAERRLYTATLWFIVRAVSAPSPSTVLSASRDATAIAWTRSEGSAFAPGKVYHAGSRYINSLTYIPPTADAPAGFVVTGGQDTVINVFSLAEDAKDEPVYSLVGHSENVCALDARPDGTIISGSWDRTARVWQHFQPLYELKGHEYAVWAVLAIEDDQFLTGSADKTIKLWKQNKVAHTFTGHKDVVRGLARIPDIGFASCSNDSEINVWTLGGDIVYNLSGHSSFVYSLAVLPSSDLVSAGEDRSARVWKSGEVAQTIVHPAISVWSVASMPNGDIVTGSSDGVVRVFSEAPERWANEADLKAYDDEVARQALPAQQVGDVKKSDLPGLEALGRQGKKDGQNLMIRNGDKVEVYQWASASGSWQKIGDVVDAVGQNRRQIYNGREYDYVFDVDIQDGVPPLKLPYNVTENPFSAAQKFLQDNELPLSYIDEVVRFIEKNTAGVSLGTSNQQYVDPYTGASSYRAGSAPSTGGATQGPLLDPFTGASSYRTTPAPTAAAPPARILPVTGPLSFKQANLSAMRGKLLQINDAVAAELSTATQTLAPEELAALDDIFSFLTEASRDPTFDPTKQQQLDNTEVQLITSILERWDVSRRFPVIDLARLLCAFSPGAYSGEGEALPFFRALLAAAEWEQAWTAPISKQRETNILLVLRAIANASQFSSSVSWISEVLREFGRIQYSVLNKNQRTALATTAFNLSCLALSGNAQAYAVVLSELLAKILENEDSDGEAAYRALVALGNLVVVAKRSGEQAQLRGLVTSGSQLASKFQEARIKDVEREIRGLL